MEPPRGDVRNPRCELKAQQMAQRENVIGHAAAVGVMTFDRQFRAMMQQAVKDVCSLTRAGGNHLGMKWRIAIRNMGVEGD